MGGTEHVPCPDVDTVLFPAENIEEAPLNSNSPILDMFNKAAGYLKNKSK